MTKLRFKLSALPGAMCRDAIELAKPASFYIPLVRGRRDQVAPSLRKSTRPNSSELLCLPVSLEDFLYVNLHPLI